jgi:hypothetical protein
MENMNLLDLNNDILNIIGGYVRADNKRRIRKENDFEKTDFIMNRLKENNKFNKYEINEAIYSQLFKNCCTEEEIKEYVETRNLTNYFIVDNIGKNSIKLFKIIKKSGWNDDKPSMRHLIVNYLYVNNIRDIETIDMYLTLMKLNLKQKKYTFSTYCIYNLEECIKIYDEILEKNTLNVKKLCFLCIL